MTTLVKSGYGLLTFLFSSLPVAHLHFTTSFPMPMIFPVPPPEKGLNRQVYSETSSSTYEQRNSVRSHTHLLNYNPHPDCILAPTNHIRFFLAQKNKVMVKTSTRQTEFTYKPYSRPQRLHVSHAPHSMPLFTYHTTGG